MSTYESVLSKIVSRSKPVVSKRVDNNTYAERRIVLNNPVTATNLVPNSVEHWETEGGTKAAAIRLHATDIVTYTEDGYCVLNTGGWKTVTTKARINDWAPMGVQVWSVKGEWRLHYGRNTASVPFVDGITLRLNDDIAPYFVPVEGTYPDATREEQIAAAKKKLDKDIKAFTALLPAKIEQWRKALTEEGGINTAGDCWYCLGIVTTPDGGPVTSTDHLWAHLRDGYLFPTLVLAALADKGYRDPRFIFTSDVTYGDGGRLAQHLTKYLRKRLEPGQEPAANVVDNVWLEHCVSQAVDVLEKPSDFGYFGGDENLWKNSAPTWTKHRDSTNDEVANFEVVWNTLKAEFPELVPDDLDDEGFSARAFNPPAPGAIYVFGAGHWAVGHIDQIVVPVKVDVTRPVAVDNLHPAFIRLCEFGRAVRDYPVLDGAEDIVERLDQEDRRSEAKQYLEQPTDEQVQSLVVAVLQDQDGEWPGYLETEEWHRIITSVEGLVPAAWVTPAEVDA